MYRSIVELDALSDPDWAGSKYNNRRLGIVLCRNKLLRLILLIICRIEIRRLRRELGRTGIYHLEDRMLILRNFLSGDPLNRLIRISQHLRLVVQFLRQRFLLHLFFEMYQMQKLIEEPLINHRDLMNLLYAHASFQSLKDNKQPFIVTLVNPLKNLLIRLILKAQHVQRIQRDLRAADRLHQSLFKTDTDSHDLARRLHLRPQGSLRIDKLIKRPLGQLNNRIVDRRLKAGIRRARHRILDLIQCISNSDFRRHFRNRIPCRFRRQRRRTGYTRIHLDDRILHAFRMQRELYITAALYAQGLYDIDRSRSQHLIFLIR